MRVRTGRFVELRSRGQPRHAEVVEVADGEGEVNELCRVSPPTAAAVRNRRGFTLGQSPGAQLAIDGCASFPLFEVDGSESVTRSCGSLRSGWSPFGGTCTRKTAPMLGAQTERPRAKAHGRLIFRNSQGSSC